MNRRGWAGRRAGVQLGRRTGKQVGQSHTSRMEAHQDVWTSWSCSDCLHFHLPTPAITPNTVLPAVNPCCFACG